MSRNALLLILSLAALVVLPTVAAAQVKGPGPYESKIRQECIAEMLGHEDKQGTFVQDNEILVACKSHYSNDFHEQDAAQATKNKEHVVMAYAAIWAIVTIFLVLMWLRQRKLSDEILRLETELKKAMAES